MFRFIVMITFNFEPIISSLYNYEKIVHFNLYGVMLLRFKLSSSQHCLL